MRRPLVAVLIAVLTSLSLACGASASAPPAAPSAPAARTTAPAKAASLPARSTWLKAVAKAYVGSRGKLDREIAKYPRATRKAIVLDIDNTSIATQYDYPHAVAKTLAFAKYAVAHGVTVFFVTGRPTSKLTNIRKAIQNAGYHYKHLYGMRDGEKIVLGKQRCRKAIRAAGYKILVNVGNRSTDFTGGGFNTKIKLPDFGNRLG